MLLPFYGDSDKPNVFNNGSAIVVSWVDKYCAGGAQGSVTYLELDEREIPYSCTYAVRSLNNGATWSAPQQLSSGLRDAKGDVSRGSDAAWVMTWQEDPQGLQRGDAEGPGDGASGAKVSHGTDIWYTNLNRADFDAGTPFPASVRLTNNFTHLLNQQGNPTDTESGQEGASRANLGLLGPNVILAYEETKGTEGVDDGKYVRYHTFRFDAPPTSCVDDPMAPGSCQLSPAGDPYPDTTDPERVHCIISDPGENARRVRFFGQGTPGPTSGIQLFMIWKQGEFDQGGPSDIMARSATGLTLSDFSPALAVPTAVNPGDLLDGCLVRGEDEPASGAYANAASMNLSAETEEGGDLMAGTGDNEIEDARAHRGILKGDLLIVGYSYTPDWAVARFTDLENYDFYIRHSTDGGATWSAPLDMTTESTTTLAASIGLPPNGVNVKEPRIVKTPGNGPGCPTGDSEDPTTTRASDCTSPGTVIIAWGTETNVYEHLGGSDDLDIFITRTTDRGASYEPYQVLAGTNDAELESQLRPTPDGDTVYSVWNEESESTGANAVFSIAVEMELPVDPDAGPSIDGGAEPDAGPALDGGTEPVESSGGCSCHVGPGHDSPTSGAAALALLALTLFFLHRRRRA